MAKKAGSSPAGAKARKALFVEAYCTNGNNGTQAAITAGYSVKCARSVGSRLLAQCNALIEQRKAEILSHAEDKTLLTAEEVLRDLANAMRVDPADMHDPVTGAFLPMKDIPLAVRRELEGYETQELGAPGEVLIARTHKVKLSSKTARREQAMKHFGLFEKDNSQKPTQLPPVFNIIAVEPRR